ncbi:MAG: RagB/SusD family nutrient uptake outer membrane protein [Bacteroidales bacterium]|nr:RagB/SusD family nutrient uptake outer membrane protein [Bacteroidales bacterium]
MKLSSIYNIVLAGLVVLGISSCEGFLDTEPDERITVQSDDQILQLTTSIYPSANYGWLCEISSDNIIDNTAPHLPADANSKQIKTYTVQNYYDRGDEEAFKFEQVKSNTSSDSPKMIWSSLYSTVGSANIVLQYIDEAVQDHGWNEKLRAAYAEALLNRAYAHFLLVNIFSQAYKNEELSKNDIGICYNREVETKVHVHYERGTVAQTYAEIEKDLEEALKYVTDRYYSKPKWHFNVNAAHAFAARFYLFKHDYEKVIEHADAVLTTDSATIANMVMTYKDFDKATYSSDYNTKWISTELNNNLMLLATNSTQWRRSIGCRFACNGLALRALYFRSGPTWGWTIVPAASVSGGTFWDGNNEHGYAWAKIGEQFEFSDKISGIGYAHVIRREFTCNELLLCRAEALLLGRHDKEGCFRDLAAWEQSRQNFSEESLKYWMAGGNGLQPLTMNIINGHYTHGEIDNIKYLNCFPSNAFTWADAANMGVNVAPDEERFMNCINDYRRYETAFEGLRFFDLKRWGIPYTHEVGHEAEKFTLTWDDPRRAIEIPADVIAAGHEASQPLNKPENRGTNAAKSSSFSIKFVGNE